MAFANQVSHQNLFLGGGLVQSFQFGFLLFLLPSLGSSLASNLICLYQYVRIQLAKPERPVRSWRKAEQLGMRGRVCCGVCIRVIKHSVMWQKTLLVPMKPRV